MHLQGLFRDQDRLLRTRYGALCGLFVLFLPSGPVLTLSFFVAKLGSHIRTPSRASWGVCDGAGCWALITPQLGWEHFGRGSGAGKERVESVPRWLGAD